MARSSRSARRAGEILCYLAAHPQEAFTSAELARRLGMNVASCHTVMNALQETGLIARHPTNGLYSLAPYAIAVGDAARRAHPAVDVAAENLEALVRELDVEGIVTVPAGDDLGVVAQLGHPRPHSLSTAVGTRFPLVAPIGSLFVAWSDRATVDRWLARGGVHRDEQARYLEQVLDRVRARGYAIQLRPPSEADHLRDALAAFGERPEGSGGSERTMVAERAGDQGDGGTPGAKREGRTAPRGTPGVETLLVDLDKVLVADLRPSERYPVHSLAAPVFAVDGQVAFAMYIIGFQSPMRADEVATTGERLFDVAQLVTRVGHGAPPPVGGDGRVRGVAGTGI